VGWLVFCSSDKGACCAVQINRKKRTSLLNEVKFQKLHFVFSFPFIPFPFPSDHLILFHIPSGSNNKKQEARKQLETTKQDNRENIKEPRKKVRRRSEKKKEEEEEKGVHISLTERETSGLMPVSSP